MVPHRSTSGNWLTVWISLLCCLHPTFGLHYRWIGRQILEVISTEFRDRSVEYYVSPDERPSPLLFRDICPDKSLKRIPFMKYLSSRYEPRTTLN
jgi:hypothetical protein